MTMVVVFAAALGGLIAWTGWLWRRTLAPVWSGLVALLPIGLGAWCVVAMASAFIGGYLVPETLAVSAQVRQVAMHDAQGYRWGMRFWAAGLVSAGWLLFVMWRWEAKPEGSRHWPLSRVQSTSEYLSRQEGTLRLQEVNPDACRCRTSLT